MKAYCVCGEAFYAEHTTCICPRCGERITLIREEPTLAGYRYNLDEVLVRIERSNAIHGDWSEYSATQVFEAVTGEVDEYLEAFIDNRIAGKHGQIDELKDVVTVAIKGIARLECLQS